MLRHVQNLNQSHGVTVYAWTAVTPKAKSRWTLFPVLYSKKILQKLILESLWNTSHVNSRVLVESYLWNMPRILIVVKCLVTMKHDAFSTTGKRDMKNTEMFTRVLFRRFIPRVGKSTYPTRLSHEVIWLKNGPMPNYSYLANKASYTLWVYFSMDSLSLRKLGWEKMSNLGDTKVSSRGAFGDSIFDELTLISSRKIVGRLCAFINILDYKYCLMQGLLAWVQVHILTRCNSRLKYVLLLMLRKRSHKFLFWI